MENEGVDRVFGERGIVGKSVRRTYKYDDARLKEILEPLGRLDDVMKIDGIALKKVSGELPLSAKKEIEEARVLDKESVSLSLKKGSFLDEEESAQ